MEAMTRELTLESGQCSVTNQQVMYTVLGAPTKGKYRLQGRVPPKKHSRVSVDEINVVIATRLGERMRALDRRYEERTWELDRRDEERTQNLNTCAFNLTQMMQYVQNQQGPQPPPPPPSTQ